MIFRNHLSVFVLKDVFIALFIFLLVHLLSKDLKFSAGLSSLLFIIQGLCNLVEDNLFVIKLNSNSIYFEEKSLFSGKKAQEILVADIKLITWNYRSWKPRLLTVSQRRMDIIEVFLKDDSAFKIAMIGINLDKAMKEIDKKYEGIKIEKTFI